MLSPVLESAYKQNDLSLGRLCNSGIGLSDNFDFDNVRSVRLFGRRLIFSLSSNFPNKWRDETFSSFYILCSMSFLGPPISSTDLSLSEWSWFSWAIILASHITLATRYTWITYNIHLTKHLNIQRSRLTIQI